MKKLLSLFVFALFSLFSTAQISKTLDVLTPGTLNSLLTATEKTSVTNLTLTGNINARDILTMRDNMPQLAVLDIGAVIIKEYMGNATSNSTTYPANEIPEYSFYNGSTSKITLKTIILPISITSIGSLAFYGCLGLSGTLIIPNLVNTIGEYAFFRCTNFTGSLTFGSELRSIRDYAFAYCSGFKNIYSLNSIPPSISGTYTFYEVVPLKVFVTTSSLTTYKSAFVWSGFNIVADKRVNINVSTAGSLVTSLIIGGFGPLSSITHLTITGNINSEDINNFKNYMTSLTSINMTNATIASNTVPDNAFQFNTSITSITLPITITSIGDYAFDGCKYLEGIIPLPMAVTSIGDFAYQNCNYLSGSLNIPVGVTNIGNSVFSGCSNLSGALTLPNTITSIGTSAFSGCSGFTGSLNLPNTLTALHTSSFSGCSGFTGVLSIPLSVTSVENNAFMGCNKLTELYFNKSTTTTIGDYAFSGCSGLIKISVPYTIPPIIYSGTFSGVVKDNCILEVPAGTSGMYQAASFWKYFFTTESALENKYDITLKLGNGGVTLENNLLLGNGSVLTVTIGSTKTFTFTPNAGYKVATVTYNGVDVTSQLVNNQYTTTAINTNATLNVTFSKIIYRLSIKDASTGTVNLVCDYGATFNLDFTASVGWKVSTVYYNNVDVTGSLVNGVYTVPAITANSLLNVSFVTDSPNTAPEVINNNVKVYTTTSEIIIEGTSDGETIELYSINGKQIQTLKSEGERIVIPAQRDAVYLVKTAGKTFKVIM